MDFFGDKFAKMKSSKLFWILKKNIFSLQFLIIAFEYLIQRLSKQYFNMGFVFIKSSIIILWIYLNFLRKENVKEIWKV